jgi:hypothetical protein
MAVGLGAVQSAQAVDQQADPINTFTTSTLQVTTTQRADLPDAEATECDAPAMPPNLVNETSTVLDPVETLQLTFGPDTIYIGEDELTPYVLVDGQTNVNTRTTYETVVTQYFQGVAEGPPCGIAVDPRFTG